MADLLEFPIRGRKLFMTVEVKARLTDRTSAFQRIEIMETEAFGRMLLLDGHIQLTELDERAYHESLVQIPLLSMTEPRTALVVGGGDGGVIREIARHASIERIDMVEIDEAVIEESRRFLPGVSGGAFDDPRLNLVVGDAFPFVKEAAGPYDLIVVDSTDVYEEEEDNLSEMLFTEPFYRDLLRLLSPQGMVVTQADNLLFCPYSLEEIRGQFAAVFPHVGDYQALVPSFGGFSGFVYGSRGPAILDAMPTDSRIDTRYLDPITWALAQRLLAF